MELVLELEKRATKSSKHSNYNFNMFQIHLSFFVQIHISLFSRVSVICCVKNHYFLVLLVCHGSWVWFILHQLDNVKSGAHH